MGTMQPALKHIVGLMGAPPDAGRGPSLHAKNCRRLASLDVMALNPALDQRQVTAANAVALLAQRFGHQVQD